jgi:hypothetical protein
VARSPLRVSDEGEGGGYEACLKKRFVACCRTGRTSFVRGREENCWARLRRRSFGSEGMVLLLSDRVRGGLGGTLVLLCVPASVMEGRVQVT